MSADRIFQSLVAMVCRTGDLVTARNAVTRRVFDADPVTFHASPLVTLRKTAWKMAIREMEWFLSGDDWCPDELVPWWLAQLNPGGCYLHGYSQQLRNWDCRFDQVQALIDGLKAHPTSRRHLLTTWNAADMAHITTTNENPLTPACCHTTIAQFFVKQGRLYMTSYQRSADLLLGFQHNIIQTWALLLWLAHQADLKPGHLRWIFGDLHVYQEDSHLECAAQILAARPAPCDAKLVYYPGNKRDFCATDFEIEGPIPEPQVLTRPKLL
jgi:thymidylate synthase